MASLGQLFRTIDYEGEAAKAATGMAGRPSRAVSGGSYLGWGASAVS